MDKLIPLTLNQAAVDALNARIPDWVAGLTTTESPISIADCSIDAGFTTGMLRDGIHPNDQGDQLMAQQIGPLVAQYADELIAGGT